MLKNIKMGRKKKVVEVQEFIPSEYQKNIFEFIEHGNGNLVIEACAGSGKSSTLVKALDLIPNDKTVLFCAFNNDIVKELKKKIGKRDNVTISTVHSVGLQMVHRNLEGVERKPDEYKYNSEIYNHIKKYTNFNTFAISKNKAMRYFSNINKLVEYGRNNLSQCEKELYELVDRHGLDLIADEIDVALKVMKWGKEHYETIDYTDMVWLPNVLYLKPYGMQYDYIFVDEAQDLSVAQRELLFKCQKINTRYIFVGDSSQAIYSFASASPESFKLLKSLPNTISLPLSISYRCSKNIVRFANTIEPSIQYKDDASDGEIQYNAKLEDVEDGSMILCRNNAPLMKVYGELIQLGKKCFVKGKDIGDNLIRLLKDTNQEELNIDLNKIGVFSFLYKDLFETKDKLIEIRNIDGNTAINSSIFQSKLDMIVALEYLSDGITTTNELIEKIKKIFTDKKTEGISLSTIHKAKGLEADNVYIACRSLMPAKSAVQEWEVEQERNLIYVAYTRAKNKLAFLEEKDNNRFNTTENFSFLKHVENKLIQLYGMETIKVIKKQTYEEIIEKANMTLLKPKFGASTVLGMKKQQMTNTLCKNKKVLKIKI